MTVNITIEPIINIVFVFKPLPAFITREKILDESSDIGDELELKLIYLAIIYILKEILILFKRILFKDNHIKYTYVI
jgi:hypothetical protein